MECCCKSKFRRTKRNRSNFRTECWREKLMMCPKLPPCYLPVGVMSLYFIHSFFLSFPMTAYGDWLFNEIHMPPATTNLYYAMSFFPWNMKPLYGLISDNFPIFGYQRKYYILLCEVGAAISLFLTGAYISSIPGAFVARITDSSCEAFAQIMLGIFLVDVASGDREKSGNVQAWANTAKNAAAIVALIVGIPVYKSKDFDSRRVIRWTSLIPVSGILICLFLLKEL